MGDMLTNPVLLALARAGEPEARATVAEAVRSYANGVLSSIRRRQTATIEDLASEVVLRVLRRLPRLRVNAAGFRAYLHRVCRSVSTDHDRRPSSTEIPTPAFPTANEADEAVLDQVASRDEPAADLAARSDACERLREALSSLLFCRQCHLAFYRRHDTISGTARALGTTRKKAEVRVQRALADVMRILGRDSGLEDLDS